MAKWHTSVVLLGLLALAGCQPNSMVDTLPSPSFNPPIVLQSRPPQPLPKVPQPRIAQSGAPGVPKEWLPALGASRKWQYIVIHHSATPAGGAKTFDRMHKAKGWDELGYHFVIGNGTDTPDGLIEAGSRWPAQKWGAHAKTADNRYNDYGIGICLVGNFDIDRPTPQQMKSTSRLVAYLMKTYHISPDRIIGHGETKPTDCPGHNMSVAAVRRMAAQSLADAGEPIDLLPQTASSVELMVDE